MSRRFTFLTGFVLAVYLALWGFDVLKGGNDGIISGWYFHRVFWRVFVLFLLAGGLFLMTTLKKFKVLTYNLIFFGVFFVVLEIGALIYLVFVNNSYQRPSHILLYDNPLHQPASSEDMRLYGDIHSRVGRWRLPDRQITDYRCGDSVQIGYRSNHAGARDGQRSESGPDRVVFLGDSFSEGILVEEKDRLSSLLEAETGTEHLNFGIIEANPLGYSLIYKHIVQPRFEHDGVIVGIFQGNDFERYNQLVNGRFLEHPKYRPYLKSDTSLAYTLSKPEFSSESYFTHDHPAALRQSRDSLYKAQGIGRKLLIELETNSYLLNLIYGIGHKIALARYADTFVSVYEEPGWDTAQPFEFLVSFDRLVEEVAGRPVLFVVIPDRYDVTSYQKNRKNEFTPFLEKRYKDKNVRVIDLLPAFAAAGDPSAYFIPCDGHWNEAGNRLAYETVVNHPVYLEFLKKVRVTD